MKSKEQLIDGLAKIINEYSDDNEVIKTMQQVYLDKKMVIRSVGLIFKNQIPLANLSEIEQGVWCVYLYEITKESILNYEDYFTDNEVYEIRRYVEQNPLEMRTDEVVLHNVIQLIKNGKLEYRCGSVDCYTLYNINANRLATYNFKTQRDAKLTKYKNKIIKQANINLTSVTEIADLIASNRFEGNMLTFNLRRPTFSTEGIYFNEYTPNSNIGDLTIKPDAEKGIFWDVIDGQHRFNGVTMGVDKANKLGKKVDTSFMMKIPIFSEDEAQEFVHNQSKQNQMDKEHVQSYSKDYINIFVKALNSYGDMSTNKMYDMITNTLEEAEMYKKYTSINVLHDGFKLTELKFDEPFVNEMNMKIFIEVFNTILGYYQYEYKNNIEKIKSETILLESNAFVGYIAIAKELIDDKNRKETLLNMLQNNNIDLRRDTYNWESLDVYKKTPRTYKKIYSYFSNLVK